MHSNSRQLDGVEVDVGKMIAVGLIVCPERCGGLFRALITGKPG